MANITSKPNGTYLVRISCGRDIMTGKQILRGRIFKPSNPDLDQERFQKELNVFIEDFTDELQCERNRKKPENKIFPTLQKNIFLFKRLPYLQQVTFYTKELSSNTLFLCLEECGYAT